jgi:hypothetical protein
VAKSRWKDWNCKEISNTEFQLHTTCFPWKSNSINICNLNLPFVDEQRKLQVTGRVRYFLLVSPFEQSYSPEPNTFSVNKGRTHNVIRTWIWEFWSLSQTINSYKLNHRKDNQKRQSGDYLCLFISNDQINCKIGE